MAATMSSVVSTRLATMWVMPVQTFLKLNDVELAQKHQDHKRAGRLVRFDEGDDEPVAFVSHQWLSQAHPDPNLVQLHTLKTILSRIRAGALPKIQGRILARLETGRNEFVDSEELQNWISSGYLWLDFYSIPQIINKGENGQVERRKEKSESGIIRRERKSTDQETDGRFARANSSKLDEVEELQLAIKSIPDFIEACTYFFILCPPVDSDTGVRDYAAWCERGWCRAEAMCAGLGSRCEYAIIIDSADGTPHMTNISKQLDLCVGRGKFTCCDLNHRHPVTNKRIACDKVVLSAVCRKLLNAKLTRLKKLCDVEAHLSTDESGKLENVTFRRGQSGWGITASTASPKHAFRFLLAYRRHLLEGLPIESSDSVKREIDVSGGEDEDKDARSASKKPKRDSADGAEKKSSTSPPCASLSEMTRHNRHRSSKLKPSCIDGSSRLNTTAEHWGVNEFFDAFLVDGEINDVPEGSPKGFTPLRYAVLLGDLDLVSDLISLGANVQVAIDAYDPISGARGGSTLLHVAAACGSETIISALLQAGAKASARSERGFLALHLATTAEAIAALIEHCPEHERSTFVNDNNNVTRATPLMLACLEGRSIEVIKALIELGSDLSLASWHDSSILCCAAASRSGSIEAVRYLLEQVPEVRSEISRQASWQRFSTTASLLVRVAQASQWFFGTEQSSRLVNYLAEDCNGGRTALHYAADFGRLGIVRLLLEAGADPSIKDDSGKTALDCANGAALGPFSAVAELLAGWNGGKDKKQAMD